MTAYDRDLAARAATPAWRCALIGEEPLLVECATMLRERGHEIAAIVSSRAAIRDWGAAQGIAMRADPAELADAETGPLDYLFSITNLAVLAPEIVALPARAAINFHDGPLPAYAGLNTPAWALMNREASHGISWHLMEARVDTGALLATRRIDIEADETAYSLNTKCFAAAIESFAELIDGLAAETMDPVTQIDAPRHYYRRADRPAAAATIRWDGSAEEIAALVRALDFGGHANPLGAPKLRVGDAILLAGSADIGAANPGAAPGAVTRVDGERIGVATSAGEVLLGGLTSATGEPVAHDLLVGAQLPIEADAQLAALSAIDAAVARHEPWWRERLAARAPLALPADDAVDAIDIPVPGPHSAARVMAAVVAYLARIADRARFDIGYRDPVFAARFEGMEPWFARTLPVAATVDFAHGLGVLQDALAVEVRELHRRIGHAADLIARSPELKGADAALPITIEIVDHFETALPSAALTVSILADGSMTRWSGAAPHEGFAALLAAALDAPDQPVGTLPLLDEATRARVIEHWNYTAEPSADACLHDLFAEQARRTPDAPAVTSRGVTLSYAELDARANRFARHLAGLGVARGDLVGINLARSVDMMVAVIATHKAGAAYVPLDPAYPAERIAHMVRDSKVAVIVADAASRLPENDATVVRIDAEAPQIAAQSDEAFDGGATPDDLAYVIYTSGSTGLPKGVMVEHRNVANFFAGMDHAIEPGGAWLAVTSLSFDISVLELCWTAARGCHVVIATGEEMTGDAPAPASTRPVDFSLFYFASADGGEAADQYRLLLEGARFADTHDFAAVWTPERHFHAFGGLYPNPSVTSAAIAAITSRVAIRGGSVVVPLHHPIRVAEEWSLVDNLSNGRVGIAFASGWQPNDFVLRPESFADKNAALMQGIDTVRGLWRGEKRSFPGPLGKPVEIGIYPRPVQAELPFWITSAGNPDTFAAAGRAGAFILTHLLGQTVDELAAKLAHYRAAWREAGHPGEGRVTLMLHSFVGEDEAEVRAAVRQPLIDYLRTSTNLVKEFAWSFPAFKRRPGMTDQGGDLDLSTLSEEEMAGLLEFAFERYFETGGLFGTPKRCLEMVNAVRAAGVDEIGCLIDFGVPAQIALDHLPALDALRQLAQAPAPAAGDDTLAGLMARHRVTHLQCTPSMAQMLASDPASRAALAGLDAMLVGGEAFPPALAADLVAAVGGRVLNMYGPTETTIWSACHAVAGDGERVPLGRPLANQQIYILDSRQQPVPPGMAGELVIGGRGVVRGYLDRPELTAERFIAHPFIAGERAYRTGDLARQRADGMLEFLGRLDHQVKIRGHRIELGEIEAALGRHPGVERAIVAAREDNPGDVRLVAYWVPAGAPCTPAELREHLAASLPEIMIPAHFVALAELPRTPNGKVDRAALPRPDAVDVMVVQSDFVAPANDLEGEIAAVWREVLKLPSVGTRDNFFDLGGHSLLAVQVHRRLRELLGRALPLTDVFRFPTIAALAAHLGTPAAADTAARQGESRAAGRRAALHRRLGLRVPVAADA